MKKRHFPQFLTAGSWFGFLKDKNPAANVVANVVIHPENLNLPVKVSGLTVGNSGYISKNCLHYDKDNKLWVLDMEVSSNFREIFSDIKITRLGENEFEADVSQSSSRQWCLPMDNWWVSLHFYKPITSLKGLDKIEENVKKHKPISKQTKVPKCAACGGTGKELTHDGSGTTCYKCQVCHGSGDDTNRIAIEALKDIVDPLRKAQREVLETVTISPNDPTYLKQIAKAALIRIGDMEIPS